MKKNKLGLLILGIFLQINSAQAITLFCEDHFSEPEYGIMSSRDSSPLSDFMMVSCRTL